MRLSFKFFFTFLSLLFFFFLFHILASSVLAQCPPAYCSSGCENWGPGLECICISNSGSQTNCPGYCCDGGGGGGPNPEGPGGVITISPDLSDPDSQQYKSTNISAYPGYVGQFFQGPSCDIKIGWCPDYMQACWFGAGGQCRKTGSEGWDWRTPGNFIGFHIKNTWNCREDPANYTIYFKAPDNYLITRIEFDYEKRVEAEGLDRATFGLSPEVRVTTGGNLRVDDDYQIPRDGPDTGHLSFNMRPATKYIYFYGASSSRRCSPYHWAMFRNIRFDLIRVEETDKKDVDVVWNLYENPNERWDDPRHVADCPRESHHCIEKICLSQDPSLPACGWIPIYNPDTGQILQNPIYGLPYEIDDTLVSGGVATIYAIACTKWDICDYFVDDIIYVMPTGTITGRVYQNLGGVCSGSDPPSDSGWSVTCAGEAARQDSASQFTCLSGGSDQLPYSTYVIDLSPPAGWEVITGAGCQQDPTSIILDSPSEEVTPPFYIWQGAQAWFQTEGGDVHADDSGGGNIYSFIPQTCVDEATCDANFSLPGAAGQPGVVSYSTDGGADFGAGFCSNDSKTHWLAESDYKGDRYDFAYFKNQVGLSDADFIDDPDDSVNQSQLSGDISADGIVAYNGDIETSSEWNVGSTKAVIFINGKFMLSHRIRATTGGSIILIAKDGIGVSKTLGATGEGGNIIRAVFLTDGMFYPSADPAAFPGAFSPDDSDKKLVIDGAVIAWGGFNFSGRDFGDVTNNLEPVELYRYDTGLFIDSNMKLWKAGFTWQELAP